jgi:hypothetical protein
MSNFGPASRQNPRTGPTGPRTSSGKDKSSSNRATHGLAGRALVLPGERVSAYRQYQASWFTTLPCTSEGEAHVLAQVADVGWRLERLLKLEHAHQLDLLEEAMKKTPQFNSQALALRALSAVNVLLEHADAATAFDPFPAKESQLRPFIAGAKGSVSMVQDVEELELRLVKALVDAVNALETAAEMDEAKATHMAAIAEAAKEIQERLATRVRRGKASLGRLRKTMASEMVPADDRESRKLGRYRAELERSQARMLGVLDQVRAQRKAAEANLVEAGGKAVALRLRVVK